MGLFEDIIRANKLVKLDTIDMINSGENAMATAELVFPDKELLKSQPLLAPPPPIVASSKQPTLANMSLARIAANASKCQLLLFL